ncbi:MAG: TonB-dependent receptor [Gammaproteobacteria bacterium]|nr:TonB-dependent receptor [Gammaproteobacteria bacterium]MBU2425997.1 TonB-dependent receptor [Gammaproteobacteria bacterium]
MFTANKLSRSVKIALVLGVASPLFISQGVMAQEEAAADKTVEKIQVTGSRIRSANAMSTSPISTIGEIEIKQQQQPEVERIIRNLPSALPGDGSNVNNGSGGAASINLRGLGRNRNLVLMNGKRMVPFNTSGHVDTSSIPTALIDRIDLVTGGASAVYGSDAISGAMNVVLKNDFEGVEFETGHSRTAEADAFTQNASLTLGGNFDDDKGNAVMSIGWLNRDPLLLGQRALGNLGIDTASGANYSNFLDGIAPTPPADPTCGGPNAVEAGGSTTTIPTRIALFGVPSVGGQFRDGGNIGSNCSVFNFNPYNYYQTPAKRYSATALARYNLNDEHTVFANVNYVTTSVDTQVAPSGIFGTYFWIPVANPFLNDQARGFLVNGANKAIANMNATNWRDVNNNGVVDSADYLRLQIRRRTAELGPRSTGYDSDQFQFVTGVEGFLNDTWAYEVSAQHGQTKRIDVSAGYSNIANIANQLDATNKTTCNNGDSSCVPINLFGGFGTITEEMAQYARATAFIQTEYQQRVISGSINGPFDSIVSPWADSPLSMSFGYEWRQEEAFSNPDECWKLAPASCLGGAGGNQLPVGGTFQVNELFTEGKMSLVEDGFMTDTLELEFGYRHGNYNTIGDNGSWKLGLSWRINDQLVLRAMNNAATRAPNVGELYAPVTSGLDNATLDPCSIKNAANIDATLRARCIATGMTAAQVGAVEDIVSGQINVFSGSNPAALPNAEDAKTTTLGFVWTPEFETVKRVNLSVDYYDIYVDGYIGTNTPQEVLDGCYVLGNQAQCALIRRDGGTLTSDISGVEQYTTNLSYLKTTGYEVQYSFGFNLEKWGTVDFSGQMNHYIDVESLSSPTSQIIDCNGYFGTSCNPQHETRANQRVTWNYEDYSLGFMWRYMSDLDRSPDEVEDTFEAFRHISSYSYIDMYASYQISESMKLNFGVDNLTNKDAPVVGGEASSTSWNSGNTFPSHYDMLGRTYRMTFNVKF